MVHMWVCAVVLLAQQAAGWRWEQTWGDEFDGPLNRSHWTPKDNWTHCCGPAFARDGGELQLYDAEDAFTEDGRLVLRFREKLPVHAEAGAGSRQTSWLEAPR